jgi:uncharacterized membrane protein (UPF0127 family)
MFSALLLALLPMVTVQAPKATLHLEVASTDAQREHGLMDRTHLGAHDGMIFVFAADAPVSFWMKNTLIPLDMIFVGQDGTVRRIYANVPVLPPNTPDDRIPLEPGTAKYVIELNAGEAERDGIVAGTKLDLHGVTEKGDP